MGQTIAIGEALSTVEDGMHYNYVGAKFKNGAPGCYMGDLLTINSIYLNNIATSFLLVSIVPEFLKLCSYDDFSGMILNIDENVVQILSDKLRELKSIISHPPCIYHPDMNVHWAGVVEWMLWWSSYSLKKCFHPVIVVH